MNNELRTLAAKLDRLIKILEVIAGIKSPNGYKHTYYPFDKEENDG